MPTMNFEQDIADEVVRYFDEHAIKYDRERSADPEQLVQRYFRIRSKMIVSRPRAVHYSTELQAKLGTLDERYRQPFAEIEERFESGGDLAEYLSRLAEIADVPDTMLNDFGIHHLHLGSKPSPDAKRVKRSDLLLLVCVRPDDAYFVDIRPHPKRDDPDDYGWSDQECLRIIDRNWSHLLDRYELRGENGDSITDIERKELQRKNVNVVIQIGDRAIAPPGGGMTSSGANATHMVLAKRLLWLAGETQRVIETRWDECRRDLLDAGLQVEDDAEFRLVRIDDGDVTPEVWSRLTTELGRSGWIIQHVASGKHIDWDFGWE